MLSRSPALSSATVGAVSLALVVSGCSARPSKADTVAGPAVTSTATASMAPSPVPVVEVVAMTQTQIDSALLTASDLPSGWTADAPSDTQTASGTDAQDVAGPDQGVYSPAECKDLVGGLSKGDVASPTPTAQGSVSFSTENYQFLAEKIETWDHNMDVGALDEMTAALSTCPQYTVTDPDGNVTTSTISALDMPNYADRTFAVRIAATSRGESLSLTLTLDVVMVAAGNTSVSLVAGGFRPVDPADLQQVAAAAMAKVATVG